MKVRIPLCKPCAAKLRAVRDAVGQDAMIARMPELLCEACMSNVPGHVPGAPRPRFELKREAKL